MTRKSDTTCPKEVRFKHPITGVSQVTKREHTLKGAFGKTFGFRLNTLFKIIRDNTVSFL